MDVVPKLVAWRLLSRPDLDEDEAAAEAFAMWLPKRRAWYEKYGVTPERLRLREHAPDAAIAMVEGGCDVIMQIGTAKYGVRDLNGNLATERVREDIVSLMNAAVDAGSQAAADAVVRSTTTSGRRWTAAKFRPSWTSPWFDEPSPMIVSATWPVCLPSENHEAWMWGKLSRYRRATASMRR